MTSHRFRLFVMGHSVRSQRAVRTLQQICESLLANHCELEIIDVLEQPELAEELKIIATPTLIKELPLPERRFLGDLSDRERLLLALDIPQPPLELGQEEEKLS